MTTIINAATSGGLIQTADTSGELQLQTASTAALTITSAQNVGIGTASPSVKLHVSTSSAGLAEPLWLNNSQAVGANVGSRLVFTGTSSNNGLAAIDGAFAGATTADGGYMVFNTRAVTTGILTERMRLNTTGALVLAGGTTTANGIGITFPTTQSASSDANTLDDYEEGTWTPTDYSGAGLSITFNNPTYTKIGRLVFVRCSTIVYPSTANASSASIGGLPFTNASGESATAALVSSNANANRGLIVSSATNIYIYASGTAGSATNAQLSGVTIYGFCAVYIV
jgi:hypothetical protein